METGTLISVMNQAQINIFNASLADQNLKISTLNSILYGTARAKSPAWSSFGKYVNYYVHWLNDLEMFSSVFKVDTSGD